MLIRDVKERAGVTPGPTQLQNAANRAGPKNGSGRLRVLCVGEQTRPLSAEALGLPRLEPVHVAANVVEAILLSPERAGWELIIVAISPEGTQLERALVSLRRVNPRTKIVLLGEPTEEPSCRRALAWGADDYFVLPTPLSLILQLSGFASALAPGIPGVHAQKDAGRITTLPSPVGTHAGSVAGPEEKTEPKVERKSPVIAPSPGSTRPSEAAREEARRPDGKLPKVMVPLAHRPLESLGRPVVNPANVNIKLLQLPLVVQTALIKDLLQSRTDITGRLLATLQTYLQWPGQLSFVPHGGESSPDATSGDCAGKAVHHEGVTYGTLYVSPTREGGETLASLLDQSASWLGAWMAMAQRQDQLRSLAITDELSGAYNRRYFTRFVEGLIERARTERFRVSLLVFDIDNFKQYNDQFGHAAGDSIIRALIKLLRRCTRPTDLVARIGGDEFAVVFWDSEAPRQPNSQHPKDAVAATERFRKAIEAHDWGHECKVQGQVSISGGIATFPWDADTLEMLLLKADDALLRAKRAGKNVIHIHCAE